MHKQGDDILGNVEYFSAPVSKRGVVDQNVNAAEGMRYPIRDILASSRPR